MPKKEDGLPAKAMERGIATDSSKSHYFYAVLNGKGKWTNQQN